MLDSFAKLQYDDPAFASRRKHPASQQQDRGIVDVRIASTAISALCIALLTASSSAMTHGIGTHMTHPMKLRNVSMLPRGERYGYFVRKVADYQAVWGLHRDMGWATVIAEGAECVAFWPEAVFAEFSANGAWQGYLAREISLDYFIGEWLGGMRQDHKAAVIFPTPLDSGCVIPATVLSSDIQEELQQYD